MRPRIDPRLIACLVAVYLIWSSTYLALRIAVTDLPPLFMASIRYTTAGLVMLAVAKHRGVAWPSPRQWLRTVPVGGLLFLGGNGFIAIGELTVSSGGAAVVCATVPLWIGVLSALTGERPSRREWLSLVVGFAGVMVLMGGPSLAGRPLHVVLVLLSPVTWAFGSILARRLNRKKLAPADTVMFSAMQMLTGGLVVAAGAIATGERVPLHASTSSWLAVAYLVVFGSLIAFTAYSWLLRNTRPVIATSYAFVNPVLAVLVGAALSGETLGWTTLIANILIVGAVVLALHKPKPRPAAR